MPKPKFNFGDYVYHASTEGATVYVPCPDCNGDGYVTIIYQGETYTLDCEGCKKGYTGSTGQRDRYTYAIAVREGTIEGVERGHSEPYEFEYRMYEGPNSSWILKESDVFVTKEEAEARAEVLRQEREQAETDRVLQKHKPDRSWAWNVKYHKDNISRLQSDLEYHTLKLNAAMKHLKEPI